MRPLTRWLLHAIATLSLLFYAATTALWLASHRARIEFHPALARHHYYLIADAGRLSFGPLPWILWAPLPTAAYTSDPHGRPIPISNRELRAAQTRFQLQRLQAIYTLRGQTAAGGLSLALISLTSATVATPLLAASWRTHRAARRRRRRGCCPACHYNLTGNLSGICPECGTKVEMSAAHT